MACDGAQLYYKGFCKRVLWPLFHSSAPTTDETVAMHSYGDDAYGGDAGAYGDDAYGSDYAYGYESYDEQRLWQAYVTMNQAFADAVQDVHEDGDMIWVRRGGGGARARDAGGVARDAGVARDRVLR